MTRMTTDLEIRAIDDPAVETVLPMVHDLAAYETADQCRMTAQQLRPAWFRELPALWWDSGTAALGDSPFGTAFARHGLAAHRPPMGVRYPLVGRPE